MTIAGLLSQAALCAVIHVSDGDTLAVRCGAVPELRRVVIRLAEVDAPEDGQAFGAVSRRALVSLCLNRPAVLDVRSTDRYGRVVAAVRCAGQDAGSAQVTAGLAWVFDRYAKDKSLSALQDRARSEGRGLWSEADPTPPWEWRKAHPKTGRG
jgi:micrococcal nuclease